MSRKGVFIPDITIEMFKKATLESVEEFLASGKMEYIEIPERRIGEWRDYSDDGYVECPFCEHATTCNDDIEELHFCFFCGASMISSKSEIEKSKSEIVPDYRDGWRLKDTHAEYWDNLGIVKEGDAE